MGKDLGVKMSKILKKRNMTQKELADRLNISEGQLSRYISGQREPKGDMIANIATALSTTSDYLLGIERGEFNHSSVKRLIARNAENMSDAEKMELMNALFGEV